MTSTFILSDPSSAGVDTCYRYDVQSRNGIVTDSDKSTQYLSLLDV